MQVCKCVIDIFMRFFFLNIEMGLTQGPELER